MSEGARIELTREQANYLVNVLRLAEGARLLVFNGRDGEWRAALGARRARNRRSCASRRRPARRRVLPDLDYIFAPLKHARLDYMAQKAVEMGARRLRPALTRRTQASRINLDRMRANVVEAAEQCGLLALAEVLEEERLEVLLRQWPEDRLLIFCDEAAEIADPLAALRAGGRGSWQIRRADRPGRRVRRGGAGDAARGSGPSRGISLGPRVLRADTAAVAALALVQAALGDWRG